MGNYLIIKNRKGLIPKLRKVYKKYLKNGKEKFLNDFGDLNTFEDVFEVNCNKLINHKFLDSNQKELRFKTGVMEKEFYSKEFVEEVKKISKDFKVY